MPVVATRARLVAPQRASNTAGRELSRRSLLSGFIGVAFPWPVRAEGSTEGQELRDIDGNQLTEREVLLANQNKRATELNGGPGDFPIFARSQYEVRVVGDGYRRTPDGIIVKDYVAGEGRQPEDGQEVEFHYIAFNENGRLIDSSYKRGRPGRVRLGTGGLVPGCERGIKEMLEGGRRRIVVPPEQGPPVGPSTFFSAKQYEVFDIELLKIRNCQRQPKGMVSVVECEE